MSMKLSLQVGHAYCADNGHTVEITGGERIAEGYRFQGYREFEGWSPLFNSVGEVCSSFAAVVGPGFELVQEQVEVRATLQIQSVVCVPLALHYSNGKNSNAAASTAVGNVCKLVDDAVGLTTGVRRMRSLMHRASEAYIHKTDVYQDWVRLLAELDETPAPVEMSSGNYVLVTAEEAELLKYARQQAMARDH